MTDYESDVVYDAVDDCFTRIKHGYALDWPGHTTSAGGRALAYAVWDMLRMRGIDLEDDLEPPDDAT